MKKHREGTSRFKGVYWDSCRKKWSAQIGCKDFKKALGRFDSQEKAARAYDCAAKIYFGAFARLNFPTKVG